MGAAHASILPSPALRRRRRGDGMRAVAVSDNVAGLTALMRWSRMFDFEGKRPSRQPWRPQRGRRVPDQRVSADLGRDRPDG